VEIPDQERGPGATGEGPVRFSWTRELNSSFHGPRSGARPNVATGAWKVSITVAPEVKGDAILMGQDFPWSMRRGIHGYGHQSVGRRAADDKGETRNIGGSMNSIAPVSNAWGEEYMAQRYGPVWGRCLIQVSSCIRCTTSTAPSRGRRGMAQAPSTRV
jgi:hypothetical protein